MRFQRFAFLLLGLVVLAVAWNSFSKFREQKETDRRFAEITDPPTAGLVALDIGRSRSKIGIGANDKQISFAPLGDLIGEINLDDTL